MTRVPYVKQTGAGADKHRNDCGAACALMIARARGQWLNTPVDQLYDQLIPAGDTFTTFAQLRAALASVGVKTTFQQGLTPGDMLDFMVSDRLLIALVRYGAIKPYTYYAGTFTGSHFVVPVNITPELVTIHDPLTRADVVVPMADWLAGWETTPGNSVRYAALVEDAHDGGPGPTPVPERAGRINASAGAKLRSGPSTSRPVIALLAHQTPVTIIGVDRGDVNGAVFDWLRVRLADGRLGYVAAFLVDETQPGSPASSLWPDGRHLRGVHGRTCGGDPRPADFDAMRACGVVAVKHMLTAAQEMSAAMAAGWAFQVVRLFADFQNGRRVTAREFAEWQVADLDRWYRCGVRYFEIHNEPNLTSEGTGVCWADGREFAGWWLEVRDTLRARFPGCKWGFPGCSPGAAMRIRLEAAQFLAEARPAIEAADWVGVHCYWIDAADMHRESGGMGFLRYIRDYPTKPLMITEFSNPTDQDAREKGYQYAAYYQLLREYPQIGAAFSFAISGPGWEREAWVREDGTCTGIVDVLAGEIRE